MNATTAAVTPPVVVAKAPAKPKKKRPGSGIPARKIITNLVWLRRASQVGFFALFFYFLTHTAFRGTFAAQSGEPVRLPLPVEGFLLADPFVAFMQLLSTHAVYRGLTWSLGIVALTLVFGRVFCGWILPVRNAAPFPSRGFFLSRYLKGSSRVEANKTHGWQAAKYYIMWGYLAAEIAGSSIGGLLEPICVAVRAIGLVVIPALQY